MKYKIPNLYSNKTSNAICENGSAATLEGSECDSGAAPNYSICSSFGSEDNGSAQTCDSGTTVTSSACADGSRPIT